MRIVIDTREQTPWCFPPEVAECTRGTLKQGDYALEGDNDFAIERKSLNDFLGTVSSGWDRFKRELRRMDAEGFRQKIIIVEGDFQSYCFSEDGTPPQHEHPLLTPQFVVRRVAELTYDYKCAVLFAGNAPLAAGLAAQIFKRRQKELDNED